MARKRPPRAVPSSAPGKTAPAPETAREGVVTAVFTRDVLIRHEGEEWLSHLGGRFRQEERPVVGDRVRFTPTGPERATLLGLLPRRNTLTRRTADRGRSAKVTGGQVLAANVDQLVIVAALHEPPFRPGLVERFLVAAAIAEVAPLLCINKTDLGTPEDLEAAGAPYRALEIPVLPTSIHRPETLAALGAALAAKTSVLVGHSGVGKTSLLNALADQEMAVGEVGMGQVARGRHTTSTARMIPLRGGGYAIDSPGVREYGLHGLAPADLARHYPDFHPYLGKCGFGDCLHRGEPHCAIEAAVLAGTLAEARYLSYLTLLDELE